MISSRLLNTVHGRGALRQYIIHHPRLYISARTFTKGPGTDTQTKQRPPLYRRLADAWRETPTKYAPLPIAVGALLLVALQFRKEYSKRVQVDEEGKEVVRLKGPWQVHVLGALPWRNLSRLWGWLNGLELPVWFRPTGFRLYAWIFGCNLDEIEVTDLTQYRSLGEFFYRRLKDGARPVAKAALVSPADGTVLHLGIIQDMQVEQVKGITYSLDALLGTESPAAPTPPRSIEFPSKHELAEASHEEFANVNGIEYSLKQLIGSSSGSTTPTSEPAEIEGSGANAGAADPHRAPPRHGKQTDASVVDGDTPLADTVAHDASVAASMGARPALGARRASLFEQGVKPGNALFFCVVYLAPGDYHRFHSPTAWVVEKRRHFMGELFSVSPYVAKRLQNLFVLNERVALMGRWRYGFFSMVPVGATNVGSIILNFDKELRTNERGRVPPPGTYTEAVYTAASPVLNGQPLHFAEEMGGFCLGSTIVLVFEAPRDFQFAVSGGQKVRMGEMLGDVGPLVPEGPEKA